LFLVLGILHGVRIEFPDAGSTAAGYDSEHKIFTLWVKTSEDGIQAAGETSLVNLPRAQCKVPKIRNQYSFHDQNLKSGVFKSIHIFKDQ
jgi:hypothetical protein